MSVEGKQIILGVCGGIAAYKAAILCSQLKQKGATVNVIMTAAACQFIQPLTFQALSGQEVYTDMFIEKNPSVIAHIDLADHADLVLIAPATANCIGKAANGLADDMLSTTLLATEAPVWMAPAMNGHMYAHPAVQENMSRLEARGVRFLEPDEGLLACGYVGKGRLLEPEQILKEVDQYFHSAGQPQRREQPSPWWQGKKVLVTAGPTREAIDPVRYLSNHSSGKMGYAIAVVAAKAGAEVTLVSGPVALAPPPGIEVIPVVSTEEMYQAVLARYERVDVVIKAAAVADYQPQEQAPQKLKKGEADLVLTFKKTKDILAQLGKEKKGQILIGFAAETHNVEEFSLTKLERKNLDFLVSNDVTKEGAGFGTDTNIVTIYHKSGQTIRLPQLRKEEVANRLLQFVAATYE